MLPRAEALIHKDTMTLEQLGNLGELIGSRRHRFASLLGQTNSAAVYMSTIQAFADPTTVREVLPNVQGRGLCRIYGSRLGI